MPAKARGRTGSSKRAAGSTGKSAPAKIPPRKDKGDGEAAVQARIAALGEPSRSILARLHPLVMKHAVGLDPVVRYGFAIYMRDGKMVLLAAPRKSYVSFGYTNDAGIDREPVKFTSVDEIDEETVASFVRRLDA